MAMHFLYGRLGLPVNHAKCIDLMRQSAALGHPVAQYQLGTFHRTGEMGLEQSEEEMCKFFEEAAEGGYLMARYNLGVMEHNKGNRTAAMHHLRLSAAGGAKWSMDSLIAYFEYGFLHHDDLAETLQSAYRARAEMKTNGRDQYIAHLKETGEYEAEYEM
jgi:TPR repeat protein